MVPTVRENHSRRIREVIFFPFLIIINILFAARNMGHCYDRA